MPLSSDCTVPSCAVAGSVMCSASCGDCMTSAHAVLSGPALSGQRKVHLKSVSLCVYQPVIIKVFETVTPL